MSEKQPALIVYTDGTYERLIPLTGGQQTRIGQGLIDEVNNAVLPPSMAPPQGDKGDTDTA